MQGTHLRDRATSAFKRAVGIQYVHKAADNGFPDAQAELAVRYRSGLDGTTDYAKSLHYANLAIENYDSPISSSKASAHHTLGLLNLEGLGVIPCPSNGLQIRRKAKDSKIFALRRMADTSMLKSRRPSC